MKRTGTIVVSLLILGLLIFGCEKKNNCCVIIDTAVQIFYKTPSGDNLINSTADFQASNIKYTTKMGRPLTMSVRVI